MLVIIQVAKMPVSCGSWPAFWSVGGDWPSNGESDIIEGVHNQASNQMTLHTSSGCSTSGAGDGLLQPLGGATSSCLGNEGCGFSASGNSSNSEPTSFSQANTIDGGVWAMEWTSSGISVWWWDARYVNDANVLSDTPNPSTFGQPQMNVPSGGNCDVDSHFSQHNIVLNWDFCGDWAGQSSTGAASGCSSTQFPTCQSYVQGNPGPYSNVGWDVRHLKVYQ